MTRQSTKQGGVTLIEVMLTMALSALLVATVLSGRNSIRSQAQFSDGMERIKETILSVKSDALTSNNTNTGASGTGQIGGGANRYLNLGQSIRFIPNSASFQTLTILCYADANSLCTDKLNEDGATSHVTNLPWNIKYTKFTSGSTSGTNLSLVFTRNDADGSFSGYWIPGRVSNGSLRSTTLVNTTPVTLFFQSQDGRNASVTVDPATGTVTRKML